jgi:hypothetical protein
MQAPFFDSRIGAHRERKHTGRAGKTPGALQQRPSERICFRKLPERGPFLGSTPAFFVNHHMKFPKQVVREDRRHYIKVVAMEPPDRDVIHIALRFQFAERIFLRAAAVMEIQDLPHGCLLVRNDHLELVALLMWDEHIKLYRLLRLYFDLAPDKEKPGAATARSRGAWHPRRSVPHKAHPQKTWDKVQTEAEIQGHDGL